MEIDIADSLTKPVETIEGKDIVIANTVIRKVDPGAEDTKVKPDETEVDITWKKQKPEEKKPEDAEVKLYLKNTFK